jgi:uncharacterized protein YggE
LEKFPKLVSDLFDAKVARFEGVTEECAKAKQLSGEVFAKALEDARASADKLAAASGMKVTSVWAVSKVPFQSVQARILGESDLSPIGAGATPSASDSMPIYRLAPVKFSQSVHVIYLITPEK